MYLYIQHNHEVVICTLESNIGYSPKTRTFPEHFIRSSTRDNCKIHSHHFDSNKNTRV